MNAISFFVEGWPKAQQRPRAFAKQMGEKWVARAYDSHTAEGWKAAVAIAARPHVPFPALTGPLRIDLTFFFPRPLSHYKGGKVEGGLKVGAPRWYELSTNDRDNLDKAVLDALAQIGMMRNDGQACDGRIMRLYATPPGFSGCQIAISRCLDDRGEKPNLVRDQLMLLAYEK